MEIPQNVKSLFRRGDKYSLLNVVKDPDRSTCAIHRFSVLDFDF